MDMETKDTTEGHGQTFGRRLSVLIRARAGMPWIVTPEEHRAEELMTKVAGWSALPFAVYAWRASTGLYTIEDKTKVLEGTQPLQNALRYIGDSTVRAIYIMEDASAWLKADPVSQRILKDEIEAQSRLPEVNYRVVVFLDQQTAPDIPGVVPLEMPLPNRKELNGVVGSVINQVNRQASNGDCVRVRQAEREQIVDALTGLQMEQALVACSTSLAECKRLDPARLVQTKKHLIGQAGAVQWIEPDERGLDGIGGLRNLKAWLTKRRAAFTRQAREWGLPRPRALLATGVPGTGKSLTAKCIATAWQMPLLRFDVGAAFAKWVGESERGVRSALQTASAIAPCVLWVDEIEKAFAGASSGESDAGTAARVFGQFLTWLQENEDPVFLIATANDVTLLPPEFLRAGRFDATFWADVPNESARCEISAVLVNKYEVCKGIDLDRFAEAADGYTGAEMEQALISAMYAAFDEGEQEVSTDEAIRGLRGVNRVIDGWGSKLKALRGWAQKAALPADIAEVQEQRQRRF